MIARTASSIALLFLVGCSVPDEQRNSLSNDDEKKIAAGQHMEGEELEKMLSGRSISNRDLARPNFVIFGETFHEDGTWSASFQTRLDTQLTGRWRINDGMVCVEVDNGSEKCRMVRLAEEPGIYSIASMFPSDDKDDVRFQIF